MTERAGTPTMTATDPRTEGATMSEQTATAASAEARSRLGHPAVTTVDLDRCRGGSSTGVTMADVDVFVETEPQMRTRAAGIVEHPLVQIDARPGEPEPRQAVEMAPCTAAHVQDALGGAIAPEHLGKERWLAIEP